MKPALRVMLCDDAGERFFGEGPCRLLHLIEETGSLRSAAAQMGLSYSKALRLVQHAEKELGFALTCKTIGGRGGGGSTLQYRHGLDIFRVDIRKAVTHVRSGVTPYIIHATGEVIHRGTVYDDQGLVATRQ